ncbi:MAG: hypothetical protein U1F57_08655 [bacterium]
MFLRRFERATQANARIIEAILNGEKGPKRDVAALNAAAVLYVAGLTPDLPDLQKRTKRLILKAGLQVLES